MEGKGLGGDRGVEGIGKDIEERVQGVGMGV